MPDKDRTILLKIHETVKKLSKAPSPTMSPYTGEVQREEEYQSPTYPSPPLPSSQVKR